MGIKEKEKERCFGLWMELYNKHSLSEELNFTSFIRVLPSLSKNSCLPNFDQALCWPEAGVNEIVQRECPFTFCSDCDIPGKFDQVPIFDHLDSTLIFERCLIK